MKKAYIIERNNHLNYIQVEAIEERKTLYITLNHGKIKKDDLYFTERDVINALIAKEADQLAFYEHCVNKTKSKIDQLLERRKHIQ